MSSAEHEPPKRTGGPYRKPRADVYTVLLVIALVALLMAILCLYLEMDLYDFKFKGGPSVVANYPKVTALVGDHGKTVMNCGPVVQPYTHGLLASCPYPYP